MLQRVVTRRGWPLLRFLKRDANLYWINYQITNTYFNSIVYSSYLPSKIHAISPARVGKSRGRSVVKSIKIKDRLLRMIGQRALVLARDVSPHGVVPREGARAVRARHADALMPLSDVRAQVCLVSVKSLAVWTL